MWVKRSKKEVSEYLRKWWVWVFGYMGLFELSFNLCDRFGFRLESFLLRLPVIFILGLVITILLNFLLDTQRLTGDDSSWDIITPKQEYSFTNDGGESQMIIIPFEFVNTHRKFCFLETYIEWETGRFKVSKKDTVNVIGRITKKKGHLRFKWDTLRINKAQLEIIVEKGARWNQGESREISFIFNPSSEGNGKRIQITITE